MPLDKKQIFIVDDDESVCRALKLLMVNCGFEVRTFLSAEEFLSAIPNDAPGCLILDIHMPGLNGWEVKKKLIKTGSKRPVIIISADRNGGLRERALREGAVGFLQKPFNDQELINLVDQSFSIEKERDMKKDLMFVMAVLFLTTSVLGCNMMRGAGKDVENAGSSIQKTVNHND